MPTPNASEMSHERSAAASEGAHENGVAKRLVNDFRRTQAYIFFFVSNDPQRFHFSSTGFPHTGVCRRYKRGLTVPGCTITLTMPMRAFAMLVAVMLPAFAHAQAPPPLYRVFLVDGSSLSSYGEWARVDDRVVFSMPVLAGGDADQLHLVSLAGDRVDWPRTEEYAAAVRAAHYAAHRGEEDFARLGADVARVVNEIAAVNDPTERLVAAERARRALADWPDTHYGYRAKEVNELMGTLDEVIGELRVAAGLGRFDLSLSARTTSPPVADLLPAPNQAEVVQELVSAATLVDTPAEKVSLLHTVVGLIDRAVGLLPDAWASTIRAGALGSIAEEQKLDVAYARLRETTLASATRYAAQADVRALERLRSSVQEQDGKLGHRRSSDVAALSSAIEVHIDSAQRLRLAHDQWLIRAGRMRAYQRATTPSINMLTQARKRLDDIRAIAGPAPWRLQPLIDALSRERRVLSLVDPPAELAGIHALFRSASELALNAATLRLAAVEAADLEIARRASSAAAGAIMLLSRAKAELEAALRPPILAAAAQ
jgi:hypothetical protein